MKLLRSIALAAVCGASFFAVGCGSSDSTETGTNHAAADAKAMLGPISAAFDHPTGTVDATTAKQVLLSSKAETAANAASSYVPGASSPSGQPMGGAGQQCISQKSAYEATIDMSCISSGAVTGSMSYELGQEGSDTYFVFTYDNVCTTDSSTSVQSCIDGKGAEHVTTDAQAGSSSVTVAGDFDVTTNGTKEHVHYGYQVTTANGTSTIEYAAFDSNGNSYVLSASVTGDSGSITIKGKNGEYTCTYSNGGDTGSCTGSESFNW